MSAADRIHRGRRGFTLMEVIAVMVLLGLMAAGALFMLDPIARGYEMIGDGASLAAKAQMAMSRMIIELTDCDAGEPVNANGSSITFTSRADNIAHSFFVAGGTLYMDQNSFNTTLADSVIAFVPIVTQLEGGGYGIRVRLTLRQGEAGPRTFSNDMVVY